MRNSEEKRDTPILHHVKNGVSYITLNRPEVGNAIRPDQRAILSQLLAETSDDPQVRCVVLGANGKHFCTGADMQVISSAVEERSASSSSNKRSGEHARFIMHGPQSVQNLIASILDCSKPVIAVVQGAAAGMGAQLALACDLIVASETAYFVQIFVRRGILMDAGGAYLLPRCIGLQKAKELVFFGDNLSAPEAERLGLVNKVVPAEELGSAAEEYARRLADGPTTTIGLAKQLLNRSLESDRATAFREEAFAAEINGTTRDVKEGVAAFVEKREPKFVGY